MPAGYEKIRDKLIKQGMPVKEAKRRAAKIWNAEHPKNPVHPFYEEEKKKKRGPRKGLVRRKSILGRK